MPHAAGIVARHPAMLTTHKQYQLLLSLFRLDDPPGFALPAGKVEPGETLKEAAIREVKEETGYTLIIQNDKKPYTFTRNDWQVIFFPGVIQHAGKQLTPEEGYPAFVQSRALLEGPYGEDAVNILKHFEYIPSP